MFRKILTIGFLGMTSAAAFAADTQTITIQPGQGSPLTIVIPTTQQNAPYALTGKNDAQPVPVVQMRFGQAEVFVAKN